MNRPRCPLETASGRTGSGAVHMKGSSEQMDGQRYDVQRWDTGRGQLGDENSRFQFWMCSVQETCLTRGYRPGAWR